MANAGSILAVRLRHLGTIVTSEELTACVEQATMYMLRAQMSSEILR